MRKRLKALTLLLVAVLTLSASMPLMPGHSVQASVKTVKANKKYSKAKTVKSGTTRIACPAGESQQSYYVKFKAPKKGTYKITFSKYNDGGAIGEDSTNCGYFAIYYKSKKNLLLKNKAGSDNLALTGSICSEEQYNAFVKNKMTPFNKKSESVKVKLKKGEVIYISSVFTNKNAYKYTVKIKKS